MSARLPVAFFEDEDSLQAAWQHHSKDFFPELAPIFYCESVFSQICQSKESRFSTVV